MYLFDVSEFELIASQMAFEDKSRIHLPSKLLVLFAVNTAAAAAAGKVLRPMMDVAMLPLFVSPRVCNLVRPYWLE